MKMSKRLISLLVILCMGLMLIPMAAQAESGTCGANAQWSFENGVITITGSGDMTDYGSPEETPWAALRDQIVKVVFNGAITRIGNNAFAGCTKLTHITFSTATKTIGKRAFYNCPLLASADYQDAGGDHGGDAGDTDLIGDVNGDGEVDGRDVVRLMKYLAEEIDEETGEVVSINQKNADLNKDGEVNELDLLRLMKYLGGEETSIT